MPTTPDPGQDVGGNIPIHTRARTTACSPEGRKQSDAPTFIPATSPTNHAQTHAHRTPIEHAGTRHSPHPPAHTASPGWRGKRTGKSSNPDTYQIRNPNQADPREGQPQNEVRTPHNGRKPSVHSPATEAARATQVTRPNLTRSPGVRLHPKACAAVGLEAGRASPKHLRTQIPRTCMHALGTGYTRKSGETLGVSAKEGTCASRGGTLPP